MQYAVSWRFLVSDELWSEVELLLPRSGRRRGRPRMDDRQAFCAIFYVLRTGIQWKALPRCLGAPSTVHDRFQQWAKAGVFELLWRSGLLWFDQHKGLCWSFLALDGALTKAPLGGEATGQNPVDRAKSGTKRSLLVEGNGLPVSVVVEGANVHDVVLAEDTLDGVPVKRPKPDAGSTYDFEADKGYDCLEVRFLAAYYGYIARIPHNRRNAKQSKEEQAQLSAYRSRRWMVERTHSWLNRFRRLLVRWEKKKANYLAMLHLACAYITYHAGGLFG